MQRLPGLLAFVALAAVWTMVDHLFGQAAGLRFWGVCLLITTSVFANMKSIPVRIGSREAFRLEGWRKAYVLLPMTVVGLAVTVFPLEVACGIRLRGYVCP